jgi:hypothetical protein
MTVIIKGTIQNTYSVTKSKSRIKTITNDIHTIQVFENQIEEVASQIRGWPVIIDKDFKVVKCNGITESFDRLQNLKPNMTYDLFDFKDLSYKEILRIIKLL